MDQETAKKLFEQGGILIFLNVPEGTEFGIDMKSWNTGEKFRGVKMIPPGLHYVFYSAVSSTGDTAPRTGFFHNFKKGEVLAKRWDADNECISGEAVSDDEIVRLKDNIKALDGFLGPYPFEILDKWLSLIRNTSERLVDDLLPLSGQVTSTLELESCTDADRPRGKKLLSEEAEGSTSSKSPKKSRMSADFENSFLPDLKPKAGTELRLTKFPDKRYPLGATPAEITQHSLDSSYVLDIIVSRYPEVTDLIGELEFCFVCFLVGHSLEAFEQWKNIVSLLCSCDKAIKKYRKIYDLFISVLETQVVEMPEEVLVDIVLNKNFLYVKMRSLFGIIQSSDLDGQIKTKASRLKQYLAETYMWDFSHLESEDEDDAPVIVETVED